jgi:hypothetical protein
MAEGTLFSVGIEFNRHAYIVVIGMLGVVMVVRQAVEIVYNS